jgi:hypothetical protein
MPSRLDGLSSEEIRAIKETAYNLINSREIIEQAISASAAFLETPTVERPTSRRNANVSDVKDPLIIEKVHQTALRLIGPR